MDKKEEKIYCKKCGDDITNKLKIFSPILITDYHRLHKDLDEAVAIFLNENMTIENKKTMSDFSLMDLLEWVSNKKKEDKINYK